MRKTDALILFHRSKSPIARRKNSRARSWSAAVFVLLSCGACSTDRPNIDLVLAREAFSAATEVESAKYAPAYYHKAEETYRKAMALYKEQKYKEAVKDFNFARVFAERAENAARIARQKAGEEGL